jgi:hypothetical protein
LVGWLSLKSAALKDTFLEDTHQEGQHVNCSGLLKDIPELAADATFHESRVLALIIPAEEAGSRLLTAFPAESRMKSLRSTCCRER